MDGPDLPDFLFSMPGYWGIMEGDRQGTKRGELPARWASKPPCGGAAFCKGQQ